MNNTILPQKNSNLSKTEQVKIMFDSISSKYDYLNHLLSLGIDKLWRKKAVNFLKKKNNCKIILDAACGTGDFGIECLKLNPEKIIGIDLSNNMLKVAKKKTEQYNKIFNFNIGNCELLEFSNNYFDAVVIGFGVRNFQNLKQGLNELYRVLKPNGTFIILEISQPSNKILKLIYNLYFKIQLPLIGKMVSKNNYAYDYLPKSVENFPKGKEFLNILKELNFNKYSYKSLSFGTCAMYIIEK